MGAAGIQPGDAELELLVLPMDKRQAAHLRAEKVDAAAQYARQVVERVLWDHDQGLEEPQRFGLDHHRPICPEESCEQGGRRGVRASFVADGEGGPQRVVQVEDEIFFQVSRAFGIPQKKHLYFISVSGAFLGTSLPPTPNWSRFDLFIDVYSILFYCISSYTLYLFIVFSHVVR